MVSKVIKHIRQRTLLSAVAGRIKGGGGVAWQLQRNVSAKFELILPVLQDRHVSSVLDVGCNAGVISRLLGQAGFFSVGLDKNLDFRGVADPLDKACLGGYEVSYELVDKLPVFDAVLLLSVHHQMVKSFGSKWAQQLVSRLSSKAKTVLIIEFAGLNSKYSDTEIHFKDNDEDTVIQYAGQWLRGALPGWDAVYIGSSPNCKEETRFMFACERV